MMCEVVTECVYVTGFIMVTNRTISAFCAFYYARGRGGDRPFAKIVTFGAHVRVNVAVAATASVRGVALRGASRCGDD